MQLWPRTKPAEFTPNAAAGIRRALDQLQTGVLKIRPEADKLVIIGRSGADIYR
ncbi:hypothetical protein [Dyadobacter sp. 50-39]|uniref:hypothetical protein n=1 Tax=Dyadobacter sp. 50-39 TaxID=1895756 RepID=UPI000AF6FDE3|nr:hypothetical protein [Dyadobacter sp. 50-39]